MEKKNTMIVSILFLILLLVMSIGLGANDELLAATVRDNETNLNDVSRPDGLGVFRDENLLGKRLSGGVHVKGVELSGALGDSLFVERL